MMTQKKQLIENVTPTPKLVSLCGGFLTGHVLLRDSPLSSQFFLLLRPCVLCHFSRVRLSVTPGTVAHQAPLSMEFSKQEYWSGLPFPAPGDLPVDPGVEPVSLLHWQMDSFPLAPPGKPPRL